MRRVSRRVVGVGEVRRLVPHPVETGGEEDSSPGSQDAETQQSTEVLLLEDKRKK